MPYNYPPAVVQILISEGVPAVAGYVEAYFANTSMPASLFDSDGTELPWPVVADSNGQVSYCLNTAITYDLRAYDAPGSLLWSAPSVNAAPAGTITASYEVLVDGVDPMPAYLGLKFIAGTGVSIVPVTGGPAGTVLQVSASGVAQWEVETLGGTTYLTPVAGLPQKIHLDYITADVDVRAGAAIGVLGDVAYLAAAGLGIFNQASTKHLTIHLADDGSATFSAAALTIAAPTGTYIKTDVGTQVSDTQGSIVNSGAQVVTTVTDYDGAGVTGDYSSISQDSGKIALFSSAGMSATIGAGGLALSGTPTAPVAGSVWYDSTAGTLCVKSDISDTTLNVGQEMIVRSVNISGAKILNGAAVYIADAYSAFPQIVKASNADVAALDATIGLVTADIDDSSVGYVTTEGIVHDIDTSAWDIGDVLFVGSVAGSLTNVKPVSGSILQMGIVLTKSTTTGSVYVSVRQPSHLADLHDVSRTPATNGQVLRYDNASSLFVPHTLTASDVGAIAKDGTTTTTGQIPFALGFSSAAASSITLPDADSSLIPLEISSLGTGGLALRRRSASNGSDIGRHSYSAYETGQTTNRTFALTHATSVSSGVGTYSGSWSVDVAVAGALVHDVLKVGATGLSSTTLAGSGAQMLVTDNNGLIGKQAIPTAPVTTVFGKTGAVANIVDSVGWLHNDGAGNFAWSSPSAIPAQWLVKTSAYTAVHGDKVLLNTTAGAFSLTLPATPSAGDFVQVGNGGGWDTNAVTILRNGSTIMGLAENMVVDTNTPGFTLVYNGTTWRITP